jgi:hypothetical protein
MSVCNTLYSPKTTLLCVTKTAVDFMLEPQNHVILIIQGMSSETLHVLDVNMN